MSGARLTRETLEAALEAIKNRGSEPRHDCRHDGHIWHFNLTGVYRCAFCGKLEVVAAAEDITSGTQE